MKSAYVSPRLENQPWQAHIPKPTIVNRRGQLLVRPLLVASMDLDEIDERSQRRRQKSPPRVVKEGPREGLPPGFEDRYKGATEVAGASGNGKDAPIAAVEAWKLRDRRTGSRGELAGVA